MLINPISLVPSLLHSRFIRLFLSTPSGHSRRNCAVGERTIASLSLVDIIWVSFLSLVHFIVACVPLSSFDILFHPCRHFRAVPEVIEASLAFHQDTATPSVLVCVCVIVCACARGDEKAIKQAHRAVSTQPPQVPALLLLLLLLC